MRYVPIILLVLVGCSTVKKAGRLKNGMTMKQVKRQIGKPMDCYQLDCNTLSCTYSVRKHRPLWCRERWYYCIQYTDGKLSLSMPVF